MSLVEKKTTILPLQQKFCGGRDFTPTVYFKKKKKNNTEQQNSIEPFKSYSMHENLCLCKPTVTVNTFKNLRLGNFYSICLGIGNNKVMF